MLTVPFASNSISVEIFSLWFSFLVFPPSNLTDNFSLRFLDLFYAEKLTVSKVRYKGLFTGFVILPHIIIE